MFRPITYAPRGRISHSFATLSASLALGSPMCQPCSSRPRLPRGFSRLWSGPAAKPSSEIDMWQVVSGTRTSEAIGKTVVWIGRSLANDACRREGGGLPASGTPLGSGLAGDDPEEGDDASLSLVLVDDLELLQAQAGVGHRTPRGVLGDAVEEHR